MTDFKHTVCPCGAHMLWAVSINGKPQPFDAEPSEKGNVVLQHVEEGKPPVARVIPAAELAKLRALATSTGEVLKLFVAHHATCPRVAEFKRGGKKGSATQAKVFGEIPTQ